MTGKSRRSGISTVENELTTGQEEQLKEDLQYRFDFERLILNISSGFINIPTDEIDDGINKALQKIGEFTASDHCYLFIFANDGLNIEKTYEWCSPGNSPFAQELRGLPVNDFPWSIRKLKKNEIIYVSRVQDLPQEALIEKKIVKKHSISSFVIVPMINNKLLIGFLGFATVAKEKRWKEEEISLLKILGEIFINSLIRKRSEESLRRCESMLRMITNNMNDFITQINKDGAIKYVSPSFKNLGYDPSKLTNVTFFTLIHPEDRDKIKKIISAIFNNKSPEKTEFRFRHEKGNYFWIEATSSTLTDDAGHVTGAVLCLRDILERKQNEKNINLTLEKIIEAMEIIVEMRDPFTARHQQQVSKLAVAIAEEMGLSQDEINGIRLAAAIHDIGKIYVPAEILTRPGKISSTEFSLIKTHPLMGYEILKKIEFPWPIAKMVAQHHERLDGSGYPEGLSGENILFEARIITVADVVEAMASHRPYRPAYGVKNALEEISKNNGLLYDEQVVEACLRLFRRKGFRFKKAKGRIIDER
jgi:PAS domain S-box-containing protein/putative nucleotidyltransferase with HDIG domain